MQLIPAVWWDMATWQLQHYVLFTGVIRVGYSILGMLPDLFCGGFSPIPRRGKHLDVLEARDRAFIRFNKWVTALMVMNMLYYCAESPNMLWRAMDQVRSPHAARRRRRR